VVFLMEFLRKKAGTGVRELDAKCNFWTYRSLGCEHIRVIVCSVMKHLIDVRECSGGPTNTSRTLPGIQICNKKPQKSFLRLV